MILVFLMVFEIAAAMAIGFVLGRIYQIRRDELGATCGATSGRLLAPNRLGQPTSRERT